MLSGLKELGYPTVESLWYHGTVEINEIVPLKDDMGPNRMKIIAVVIGNVHFYVLHPMSHNQISMKCQYFHLSIMM